MVDHDAFETMEEMMDVLGQSIGLTSEDYYEKAATAFEYLEAPGGHIQPVASSGVGLNRASEETLATWNDDNMQCSYGIDASTTQERGFSNGLRVLVANAKAGVIGAGHHPIGDESHVVAGVFDRQNDTGLETQRFKDDDGVRADLQVFTDESPGRISRLVQAVTRSLSEGRHLSRVVDMVDAAGREGPVFVDGPIYPPMVFPEVVSRYNAGDDDAWTNVFGETVGNYIDAMSWAIDGGWPVVGIVKDMDSSSLVSELDRKLERYGTGDVEQVWSKDKHFLTDLLQTDSLGTYVYTNWFKQTKRYSATQNDDGEQYVEPFAGSPHCTEPEEAYHRAYFYLKNPRTDTITRVEAPRALVEDKRSREMIQRRSLAEIAKTGESAEAILRADTEARISRQNQQQLFANLYGKMQEVRSYNHDYRGPEYTGESD
jgi:hypothetical protein